MKQSVKRVAQAVAVAIALTATGSWADEESVSTNRAVLSVNAGYDQVAPRKASVTMKAAVSNASASVKWQQLSGSTVTLRNATTANASFTAPNVAATTTLKFRVTVTDSSNNQAKDDIAVEVWVPFNTTADPTLLGNFSGKSGWKCDQDLRKSGYTSSASMVNLGTTRVYTVHAIPAHAIGTFPNAGNPNTAVQQLMTLTIPSAPVKQSQPTDVKLFGFTKDGVTFDRNTAECYNNGQDCNWRYEAVTAGIAKGLLEWSWIGTDCNNGHVQPNGNYHYHGLPESLINKLGDTGKKMVMVGYAADGFPVYARWGYKSALSATSGIRKITGSYTLKSGTRTSGPGGAYDGTFVQDWQYVSGSGDLDQCNGRFGVTPEYPAGIYHYYLTDDYPYIPSCVYGKVVDTDFSGGGMPPPR